MKKPPENNLICILTQLIHFLKAWKNKQKNLLTIVAYFQASFKFTIYSFNSDCVFKWGSIYQSGILMVKVYGCPMV